jgi:glycine oxidase
MSEVRHVVVVGGGVAGCATAHYLSAAGLGVTLVEREGLAAGASGWSAGGLNPLYGVPEALSPFAMASYREHLRLWPEIERLTGRSVGGRIIDMALVAPTEADIAPLQETGAAFEAAGGFSARWLDRAEFLAFEPRIAPHVAGALLTRGNGVVDSEHFTKVLAAAAQAQGATVRAGTVTGIQHADQAVTGVVLEDGVIPCDAVVIATGPWSGAAAGWFDCPMPVEPLKGEIVRVAPAGPPLACDVVTPAVSLFSRVDGQVWIGATQEKRGFDREVTTQAYALLRGAATHLMPSLADATLVRQTACLRPISPDGMPILGAVPGWSGAFLATAAGTKGILLAPAMARAVADLIVTGQTAIPLDGCSPGRY